MNYRIPQPASAELKRAMAEERVKFHPALEQAISDYAENCTDENRENYTALRKRYMAGIE